MKRCDWVSTDELYIKYHDEEWGKPVYDDATIFESLVLESFQAGLSWITVLKKRENFRKAFDALDYEKIVTYNDQKVEELMQDAGIIRNRLKILATIQILITSEIDIPAKTITDINTNTNGDIANFSGSAIFESLYKYPPNKIVNNPRVNANDKVGMVIAVFLKLGILT